MQTTTSPSPAPTLPAWFDALAGVNVHAIDAACAALPTATVWEV